ncbi:MAG: GTP-binding protein, partial [Rhodospirillales bacterium]|nr:GTP-binding protein [Rhodospirillales bacterium]
AVADRIVLTKTDIAKDPASRTDMQTLREGLSQLNPGATILDGNDQGFDIRHLFDTSLYDPATKGFEVQRWLNAEAFEEDHHTHHHEHHHHKHDVNRHGKEVQAFSLVLDEPISSIAFMIALELLIANQGADLLRVKGIINLAEKPDKPVIIHGVQHIFHEPVWLDKWPTEDRRTKLVFITRNIPQETIESFFRAWQRVGDEREAPTPRAFSG